jgi:hypothetical protein
MSDIAGVLHCNLNSKFILPLHCKNLRALVERGPEFWISVQSSLNVDLRTGQIAIFQLLFSLVTEVHRHTLAGTARDDDRDVSANRYRAGDNSNEECNYSYGHNLIRLVDAICKQNRNRIASKVRRSFIAALVV